MVIRNKLLNINNEGYNALLSELKINKDFESYFEEQFERILSKKEVSLMSNAEIEEANDYGYRGYLDSMINNALIRVVILIGLINSLEITENRTNFLYEKMILILNEQYEGYKILKLSPVDLKDINNNFNEELLVNNCIDLGDKFNLSGEQNKEIREELYIKIHHNYKLRRMVRNQIIFMLNNFYNDNLHNQEITYRQFISYIKKILKLCKLNKLHLPISMLLAKFEQA